MDDFVNVRSALLEDFATYQPFIETYTDEKLAWATTGAQHSFPKFPPQETFPELLQAFSQQ
ncbi:hypothetical protein GCM10009129_11500 [Psychrobacter aestuarii]|uniref:GNAT family N-acetyltransferase n=2 Tax=Psychrobacter aestuarii TaxID=556327 RepID=A0ABP3FIH0_9GAMM